MILSPLRMGNFMLRNEAAGHNVKDTVGTRERKKMRGWLWYTVWGKHDTQGEMFVLTRW